FYGGTIYRFKVENKQGVPVAGAKVRWQIASTIKSAEERAAAMPETQTDENGLASLPFKVTGNSDAAKSMRRLNFMSNQAIILRIEHSDHPPVLHNLASVDQDAITLPEATTIEIRAVDEHNKPLSRLYPDYHAQQRDWSEKEGVLTLRNVDLSSHSRAWRLRILQIPEAGPALYSDLIELKEQSGNTIKMDATLRPGVRVEGKLDAQVPRPVKGGQVVGIACSEKLGSVWQATADIAADGTFVFESLPAEKHLQVVAVCDGWTSKKPAIAELEQYGKEHPVVTKNFAEELQHQSNWMQLHCLQSPSTELNVPMERAAACEVTVLDRHERPIPGVAVAFLPGWYNFWRGVITVGYERDRLADIRQELTTGQPPKPLTKLAGPFIATTNDKGVAIVTTLPATGDAQLRITMFQVLAEEYSAVGEYSLDPIRGNLEMLMSPPLTAGQTAKRTVYMRKDSDPPPPPADPDSFPLKENPFSAVAD
ncbi:MAG: hypothetical protein SGJ20_22520, partial [Planctomycetota bacterium]|nr:hypothetical protein [Planctomycetota bacterium]